MISRGGYVVYSWGDQTTRFDLKSTTKSIGGTALGLALADNMLLLTDTAQQHLPSFGLPPASNSSTGWLDDIQIINLATHTAGFAKKGGYGSLFFTPGTHWSYSDEGVNWLADVLTWIYREDLNSLLSRRIFGRLGITSRDLVWRSNAYREDTLDGVKRREFGSGITANVDAMGRIGYLYLREGNWEGEQLIPSSFVSDVRLPHPAFTSVPALNRPEDPNASRHYGLLWWTNADGTLLGVPADAYWSWGLWDSLIVVIPSLDLIAVRAGPRGFDRRSSDRR
jgi:CubicO group peptidase (beta-lactamase class C family)